MIHAKILRLLRIHILLLDEQYKAGLNKLGLQRDVSVVAASTGCVQEYLGDRSTGEFWVNDRINDP
jgi:hypothetical protein